MISKELLSEVLNIKGNFRYGFDDISIPELDKIEFNRHTNKVFMSLKPSMLYGTIAPVIRTNSINVYELAHKCKEWAKDKKYPISSLVGSQCNNCQFPESSSGAVFYGDTEPEAIFKACEWILNNKQPSND